MSFYNNFISACNIRGIPPTVACKNSGISESAYKKWEKSSPKSDTIIKLASTLNFSIDYLLTGKEPTIPAEYQFIISSYQELSKNNKQLLQDILTSMIEIQLEEERRSQIKVITIRLMRNKVSAGIGYDLNFNSDDDFKNIKVLDTPEAESADFAVTVEGESMSPDFHDGDIVLVKQQDNIDIGQIGIFTIDGDGYIKEYGEDCLISHNPKYPDIYPEEYQEVKCYGLVLGKTTII